MNPSGASGLFVQLLAADVDEDVLRALSVRERRYVVYFLLEHDRTSVAELADVLAGWLAVTEGRATTVSDRESLLVALYHNHLPRLADAGIIDFDEAEQVVASEPLSGPVRDLVQATYDAEHRTDSPSE